MNTESIAPYLAGNLVIDTRDAGEMEDALKTRWQARSFAERDSNKAFHSVAGFRALERLSVSFGYYRSAASADFDGVGIVRQHFIVGGTGVTDIRRKSFVHDQSHSCVIPPDIEAALQFDEAFQHITFRIPPANLESMLTSLTGVSPRGGIKFKLAPASGAHFDQLRRFALFLADEVGRSETPSVVIRELEDVFMTQFLAANDHNHRETLAIKSLSATPRQVQLVEDYIVANWDKAFTIEDLAQMTDVSVRTIYATFNQHRGYGPKAFLRQVRLNKARELLQQGRYDIAAVARMCCFPSAGRFARYYRAAFGELPSETRR